MPSSDIDRRKRELCDSFDALADTMRNCAELASSFSKYVAGLPADANGTAVYHNNPSLPLPENGKRKRATRAKKDPDAPKRPSSAYLHFQNDVRAFYKESNPGLPYAALVEEMAKKWKELTIDEKKKYNDRVTEDRKRFERENREYKLKKGIDPDQRPLTAKEKKAVGIAKVTNDGEHPSNMTAGDDSASSVAEDEHDVGTAAASDSEDPGSDSSSERGETVPPLKKAKKSKPSTK